MYAIKLKKTHKAKLLEMCKALFPEYKYCVIPLDTLIFNKTVTFRSEQWIDLPKDEIVSIHWFEFCMIHLATVLYNKLDNPSRGFTILYYRGMILQEANHPIDYLYEEFKKLK